MVTSWVCVLAPLLPTVWVPPEGIGDGTGKLRPKSREEEKVWKANRGVRTLFSRPAVPTPCSSCSISLQTGTC
jgi:hypothetical protein